MKSTISKKFLFNEYSNEPISYLRTISFYGCYSLTSLESFEGLAGGGGLTCTLDISVNLSVIDNPFYSMIALYTIGLLIKIG